MLLIQDPVHGCITLDGMFADIVNTPEFQRLRSIEQVSFRPAYPGARHDRFIHSLGTYHLATKFAEHFFRNLAEDTGIKVSSTEKKNLTLTFLYAALLHDIGHAPFSHTTEDFFRLERDPSDPDTPLIWTQLADAIGAAASHEYDLFRNPRKPSKGHKPGELWYGAPHEVASAVILVSKWDQLTNNRKRDKVDLALAARMVIGYTYSRSDLADPTDPAQLQSMGIKNCLIQLINSSILDVDRLDYMGRDTMMTGFVNAPLDLETLANSVTAVNLDDHTLELAFRDTALRVFDLMFQAKLSHDAWVIANPGAVYDAALREHCIREIYKNNNDMSTVFSVQALSRQGVTLPSGRHYRLLSDVDVDADLKSQSGDPYEELYTRDLNKRRIACWRSYYEFRHFFESVIKTQNGEIDQNRSVTANDVYRFVKPLLKYLKDQHILFFDPKTYADISLLSDQTISRPAKCLNDFFVQKSAKRKNKGTYSVALLEQTINLTLTEKVDPEQIRIVFPKTRGKKHTLLARVDGRNYSTYAELTDVSLKDVRSYKYFHIFRVHGLGPDQLPGLRDTLISYTRQARADGLL